MNIKRTNSLLVALLVVLNVLSPVAFAQTLTPAQLKVLREGIKYTNTEDACEIGSVSIPNGTSAQNGKAIYDYLVAAGRLQPFQAAGVIGNMVVESGLLPQRLQGTPASVVTTAEQYIASGSKQGWGLVQFTPGSKFINAVTPTASANNLGTQVAFVWDQLEGKTVIPEKTAGDQLKATTTLEQAVLAFQGNTKVGGTYIGYERPADQSGSVAERTANARLALAAYGSGVGTTSTSSTVVSCGSTAAGGSNVSINGYSLPVDQKYYDAKPSDFTKPHHDYPAADIPLATGVKIYAMTGGVITSAPTGGGCGLGVAIKGQDGHLYRYCHGTDGGSVPGAKKGDTVQAGQLIMHAGNTGNSYGSHLHLEIDVNGVKVCPQTLLDALGKGSSTLPAVNSLPRSGCTD
jgi:murein DD-endopeptidase MepM/ murein hydrolase activator NlpD